MKNFTNKALKEWSVVIEALGKGKTAMLIRRFKPFSCKEFLLFPTFNYTGEEFQNEYKPTIRDIEKKIEIRFYAVVSDVIKIHDFNDYRKIKNHYVWNPERVVQYGGSYIWIVRTFRLKESKIFQKQRGMTYVHLPEKVSLRDMSPVLNDIVFKKEVKLIKKLLS